ncbi:MAG: lipocalin family protein [Clostridia bacterium]|nr:lipocalin family protein [Clostridia bacterium]
MTKRLLSLLMAALLLTVLIAGCKKTDGADNGGTAPDSAAADNGENSIVGVYVVKEIAGQPVDDYFAASLEEFGMEKDEYLAMFGIESFAEFLVIEFREDGTCTTTAAGDEEPSTGTWKLDGNTITLTYEGEDSVFTVNGNELSFKEDDQDYLFVKK